MVEGQMSLTGSGHWVHFWKGVLDWHTAGPLEKRATLFFLLLISFDLPFSFFFFLFLSIFVFATLEFWYAIVLLRPFSAIFCWNTVPYYSPLLFFPGPSLSFLFPLSLPACFCFLHMCLVPLPNIFFFCYDQN